MASIKQQANGKWRFRLRYKENGEFKELSRSGFRTKREAQNASNEFERRIEKGTNMRDENILVREYLQTWLTIKEKQVKKSTFVKIKRSVDLHILPKFAFYKVSEVKRIDCIKWVNEMCEHLAVDSAKSYCATFTNALEDAVLDYKIIQENPMKGVKYPRSDKRKNDIHFFEKDELKELLTASENYNGTKEYINYQYYILTCLLARSGLRLGEALALTWDDLNGNTLSVNKTLYRQDGENYITPPKTESSYRNILLDKKTLKLIRSFKIQKTEYALKSKMIKLNKDLLFSDESGNFLKQANYRTYFSSICRIANIPVLSPHALRHSHAVHLLESGSNIKFVSDRLGHSTINMTANVYIHVSKKMEIDSIENYERFL